MDSTIKHESLSEEQTNVEEKSENTDALSMYLREIGQYPTLTADEEKEIFKRISNGDSDAREFFCNCNLRLVVSVAKSFQNEKVELLDLIQQGNLGLLHAVEKFDYTKGFKFSTYAVCWIRQSILIYMYNNGNMIRIPVQMQVIINKYQSIQKSWYLRDGRLPSDCEAAEEMKISVNKVNEIKSYIYNVISLNTPISEDEGSEFGDFIPDNSLTPEEIYIKKIRRTLLDELIASSDLNEIEEKVLRMRYTSNNEFCDLYSIAKQLKVTRERIRKLEASALRKIRCRSDKRKFYV